MRCFWGVLGLVFVTGAEAADRCPVWTIGSATYRFRTYGYPDAAQNSLDQRIGFNSGLKRRTLLGTDGRLRPHKIIVGPKGLEFEGQLRGNKS